MDFEWDELKASANLEKHCVSFTEAKTVFSNDLALVLDDFVSWGSSGLELEGFVDVTLEELDRINKFTSAAKYNIAINNCEHFANYVLHGINLSSQQHTWWKCLSVDIISILQPAQSISENYDSFMSQQIAEVLNENLRQSKIDKANQDRIDFWKNR
jgi:hypothetical protein